MALARETPRVVLASASAARRAMLQAAGLEVEIVPADIDEAAIRDQMSRDADPDLVAVAGTLARAKAEAVSREHRHAIVVGSDQVLAIDSRILSKPRDRDDARASLRALRGRAHALHSAVAIAIDGSVAWQAEDSAHLTMRPFSDAFLEHYLDIAGASLTGCVGGYRIEDIGIQLFESVEGDHFTILGMPLLPLLAELRARGALLA